MGPARSRPSAPSRISRSTSRAQRRRRLRGSYPPPCRQGSRGDDRGFGEVRLFFRFNRTIGWLDVGVADVDGEDAVVTFEHPGLQQVGGGRANPPHW